MRRREFIGCLAGIAGWPVVARGKQPEIPVIGYLDSLGPQTGASELNIFRKALSKAGYVEGRNVSIEFRWAEGQRDRLPALAADLVRRRVTVIVTVSDPVGCGIGGQGPDRDHTDRIHVRHRPGQGWLGRQP